MPEAVRVLIKGRVQGVGYRAWTVAAARGMKVRGWVRNRKDGSVEAVFSAEKHILEGLIEICKEGPAEARVDSIESFGWSGDIEPGFKMRETI